MNKRKDPSVKIAKSCQRCRTSKKRCVFSQTSSICKRCTYFNHACIRVLSNQGARSDKVQIITHSTNEDSINVERHETHFCSTNAAVESCSKSIESSLEECVKDDRDIGSQEINVQSSIQSSLGLCAEDDGDVGFQEKNDQSSSHSLHDGVDLSFVYDSANNSTDNIKIADCNSSGRRKLFEVSNCADLAASDVSTRFKMDFEGSATFIQCTSLCFNRTRLRGSLIVYQKRESPCWRLGIVSLFK
jgi:hypothetical protein